MGGNADKFWAVLTLVIMAFIFTAILLHATNFATVAGSLFTGVNQVGTTITAPGAGAAPTKKKGL